jgi:hypothetical protein
MHTIQRPVFRAALVAVALGLLSSPLLQAGSGLTTEQQRMVAGGNRHERDGWVYLRIAGEPRARGFQHGYLLAKEISASLTACRIRWEYESGMTWRWLVESGAAIFEPKLDPELLAEIDGMAEGLNAAGVQASRGEMVTYNGFTELNGYWWPKVKDSLGARSPDRPKESCSSFIATGSMTADGGIVLGHNTMTPYYSADCNIILEIVPATGHRILMQGVPGWIHSGTDFFITDAGLVGSETTIDGFSGFDEKGIPEFARMRRATQDASSIDQWCAIMTRGNNGGYANAWLIGDVGSNEIARLELGLKHVALERTKDGYFVGSNVAENVQILRFETNLKETDIRNSDVARRVRWHRLMKEYKGKITVDAGRKFEGDHYDTFLQGERFGSRSLCAHWESETTDPATVPFDPSGTVDAKVVDTRMAKRMSFAARWGSGCGAPFDAAAFLEEHPQFGWMKDILPGRAAYPWTEFRAGE